MKILSFFPGRIRVSSDLFKCEKRLEEVRGRLEGTSGIREFTGNARTGSVTIVYDPSVVDLEMLKEAKGMLEKMEKEALAG